MAVSLQTLQPLFTASDINGDGKLDRPEIAKASLRYLGSNNNQEVGSLLATLVQGGKDKAGLLPDTDNDKAISFSELTALAGKSGDANSIEADDFKSSFADRYQAGGQAVDMNALQTLAKQNSTKFQNTDPNFNNSLGYLLGNGGGSNNSNNMMQQFFQLMMSMMMMMFSTMMRGGTGSQQAAVR
jgi:hypothetical protein